MSGTSPDTGGFRWDARVIVVAFGLVLIWAISAHGRVLAVNDGSRWDTVWSLSTGKGFIIDQAPYPTPDMVKKDGHVYSSKPPLIPLVVAVLLKAFGRPVAVEDGLVPAYDIVLILELLNLVPLTILLLLYHKYLVKNEFGLGTVAYCMLAAAFGTLLLSYAITLNNHVIAAYCAFFSVYWYIRIVRESDSSLSWLLCGLFAGLATVSELLACALPVVSFFLLCRHNAQKALRIFFPAAAVIFGLFVLSDYWAYGDPRPFYLMSKQYYLYPGSHWNHPDRADAPNEGMLVHLFHVLIGHHGLFIHSPLLALALLGFRSPNAPPGLRVIAFICVFTTIAFIAIFTRNYGGLCQGLRWALWFVPIVLLGLPWFFSDHRLSKVGWGTVWSVLFISICFAAEPLFEYSGPWSVSPVHLAWRRLGWVDY